MNVLFAFNKRITSCISEWYSFSFSTYTEWLLRQFFHSIDTVFLSSLLPALWLAKTRRVRRTTFTNSKTGELSKPILSSSVATNAPEILRKLWLRTVNLVCPVPKVQHIIAPPVTIFTILLYFRFCTLLLIFY